MNTTQRIDTPPSADFLARMRQEWRPTAAMWVAATGAFLLVAAAGLFVAVRWDQIPDEVKLGIVVSLTGGFLFAGHMLARTVLPATGSVLYHLGAFLIPVDVAAVAQRLDVHWTTLVLIEGVVAVGAWAALGTFRRSVVLMRASAVAVVVAALGVGATTSVPAPLALAAAALAATFAGRVTTPVLGWALTAGSMPVVALAATGATATPSPLLAELTALGVPAAHGAVSAVLTGILSGGVIAVAAHQRRDPAAAFLSMVTVLIGPLVALADRRAESGETAVVVAGLFLGVQVLAAVAARDVFWSAPTRWLSVAGEVGAGFGVLAALPAVVVAPLLRGSFLGFSGPLPDVEAGIAFGLLSLGLLAGIGRRLTSSAPALVEVDLLTIGAAIAAVASVVEITMNPVAAGLALAVVAVPAALAPRIGTQIVACAAGLWAPAILHDQPLGAIVVTLAIGASLVVAALQTGGHHLPAFAAATVGLGALIGASRVGDAEAAIGFVVFTILSGALIQTRHESAARVARYAALGAAPVAIAVSTANGLAIATVLTLALAVEHIRLSDRTAGLAAAVTVQLAAVQACILAGMSPAQTGVALTITAVVWAGLSETAQQLGGAFAQVRESLIGAALAAAAIGLGLSATEARAAGFAMLVLGALLVSVGVLNRFAPAGHVGGGMIAVGLWIQFALEQVTAAELYVAPVAAHLLVAGVLARRSARIGSWAAYAPSVVLLGGSALVERLDGGEAWHAVVAGAVGAVAVMVGGWNRLAGPLFTGTALLVAVAGHESLAVVATVPTWAWLAAGGTLLLSAGIAMERTSTTPLQAGRRVVEVIAANFD